MKTKKMTDAQREAKRERDRRYRAKKRAGAKANKPLASKPVVAKNLKLKVALVKGASTKKVPSKHKITHTPLEERVRVSLIALSSLCRFIAAGI